MNNRLLHLDTAKDVIEVLLAKPSVCLNAIDKKTLWAGMHSQRRSSRPPNPPIGGGQANFGGPS